MDLSNNLKYFKSFLRLFYLPFFYIMSILNFLFNSTFYNSNVKLYSKYYMQKKKWNFIKLNKFFLF